MDKQLLQNWLTKAVELLTERGRTEVGLQHFGQVLTHTPPDPDGSWPGAAVRDLIEEIGLEHVETGLYLQILNSRGVTGRGLEDGGAQEVELAAFYQSKAQQYADDSPRVAAVFRRVAQSYLADARRNEGDAERVRRGLG